MLNDCIQREIDGTDYMCSAKDKNLLYKLFGEINRCTGTNIQYLAEIDAFNFPGAGEIIAQYITKFSSESVKGFLIPQMVADRVKDCDKMVLQLYLNFKSSDEYIGKPGQPAPANIYVRYDNAFKKLKPKRLVGDLISLARNPRDAFYLPFTMRMLASWKVPEMRDLLVFYARNRLTPSDVGIQEDTNQLFYPSLEFIIRELKFTAIDGLKHFPSPETRTLIAALADSTDKDIRSAAKRTLTTLMRTERR